MKEILFFLFLLLLAVGCNKDKSAINDNHTNRIISLTPSITRILFNLGAQDSIVGVSDFCTYKERIAELVKDGKVERVCGFNTLNFEKIIALNPTLVLGMDSISLEGKKHLEQLIGKNKIHWFIHPRNIDEIEDQIIAIAQIVNKEKKAKTIVADMKKRVAFIKEAADKIPESDKRRVIIEIGGNPFITVGTNTFLYNFVEIAGGVNALKIQSNWPTPTLEDVIAANPEIVVKLDNSAGDNFAKVLKKTGVKIFKPTSVNDFFQPGMESVNAIETLYNYLK